MRPIPSIRFLMQYERIEKPTKKPSFSHLFDRPSTYLGSKTVVQIQDCKNASSRSNDYHSNVMGESYANPAIYDTVATVGEHVVKPVAVKPICITPPIVRNSQFTASEPNIFSRTRAIAGVFSGSSGKSKTVSTGRANAIQRQSSYRNRKKSK